MTFAQPFANYEILARIGSGAMGTVFKARQKHMNRVVALKVLKPSLARDARYAERLQREARIVAKLNHPNIVTGYDLGHEGGYHYFVMEFVEGRSLRQLLGEWGIFPEEQVLDVAIQVARALDHAFACGVIHRDVKPANILIDDDGRVKLTDMGLAKVESDLALTRDGATVGTPQYISPEQARNPQAADIRSDLYSLGATLFHMATGQMPFKADGIGELIDKVLHERPASAVELNPALSDGLSLVIRKLLAKDPELRYQTPAELLADLRRVERRERPAIDRRALEAELPQPPRARSRHWPLLVAGIPLLLVAIGAIGWWPGADDPEPSPEPDSEVTLAYTVGPFRSRFEALRAARQQGGTPAALARLDEAEARISLELSSACKAALAGWATSRRAELSEWIRGGQTWRDVEDFLREVAIPDLHERFGYRPEELPTPELRAAIAGALDDLAAEIRPLVARFDDEYLRRHERYLRDELGAEALAAAQRGRFHGALADFDAGVEAFHGTDGRPPRAALPAELRARVQAAEDARRNEIEQRLRAAQVVQAQALAAAVDEGLLAFGRLRDDWFAQGGSPAPLRSSLSRLEQRIARDFPPPEEFQRAPVDPWPAVSARLAAAHGELDGIERRHEDRLLDEVVDLAYRTLRASGPAAALAIVSAGDWRTRPAQERRRAHAEALAAAEALLESLVGVPLPLLGGGEGRLERQGRGLTLRGSDGRSLPLGAADILRASAQRDPVEGGAAEGGAARRALGLGVFALLQGQRERLAELELGDALRFLIAEVGPRVAPADEQSAPGEEDARAALAAMMQARQNGALDVLRSGLANFEAEFASTRTAGESGRVRAELAAWLRERDEVVRQRAALRQRYPTAFRIDVTDDLATTIDVPAAGLAAAEIADFGRVDQGIVRAAPQSGSAQLVLPLPVAAARRIEVGVELRFEVADRRTQIAVIDVEGVAVAFAVLPSGGATAVVLESPEVAERPAELQLALASPLLAAVDGDAQLVPGAWYCWTVQLVRGRGNSVSVDAFVDAGGERPLASATRRDAAQAPPRLRLSVPQPTALRRITLHARP